MREIKYKAVYYFYFLENTKGIILVCSGIAYSIFFHRISDIKQN